MGVLEFKSAGHVLRSEKSFRRARASYVDFTVVIKNRSERKKLHVLLTGWTKNFLDFFLN